MYRGGVGGWTNDRDRKRQKGSRQGQVEKDRARGVGRWREAVT